MSEGNKEVLINTCLSIKTTPINTATKKVSYIIAMCVQLYVCICYNPVGPEI